MGLATYVFDIPKSVEYLGRNIDTILDRRVQFMRHILPRGAKLVDVFEFDHALGYQFTTKWEHPLFENGTTIETVYRREGWSGANNFIEQSNVFLGIKYFKADGTELFK